MHILRSNTYNCVKLHQYQFIHLGEVALRRKKTDGRTDEQTDRQTDSDKSYQKEPALPHRYPGLYSLIEEGDFFDIWV